MTVHAPTTCAGYGSMKAAACLLFAAIVSVTPVQTLASHKGHERHADEPAGERTGITYTVPGASFPVVLRQGSTDSSDQAVGEAAARTVVEALAFMLEHRADYPRFDESLKRQALEEVVIEPTVQNEDGKSFPFLVARTSQPGHVRLLISAASLRTQGQLGKPELLVPALAREFQWVMSKADTAPKLQPRSVRSDLAQVPIRTDQEIAAMPAKERLKVLHALFERYLRTVDEHKSLDGQPYYEEGTTSVIQPTHSDSTTKLYDIRIREALQKIVQEPWFMTQTPKAVRNLLNGRIWNVAFVKIDQRDWATRTRVLPEEKAIVVGEAGRMIQPATILINTYRTAAQDDPFYRDTNGLPMGALSADQLARVIAKEIEQNILEKSMRGHVAQDELSRPK